jgi:uncharacterized membrane protein YukC
VNFTLNEVSGTVLAENSQDQSVETVVEFRSQVFRVVMTVVIVVLLVVGWYLFMEYSKQRDYDTNAAWLTDFYEQNAPQVIT